MKTTGNYEPLGIIDRQLSATSFSIACDPGTCLEWLEAIGGTPIPTQGSRELGRFRTKAGGLAILFVGALLIMLPPPECVASSGARQ